MSFFLPGCVGKRTYADKQVREPSGSAGPASPPASNVRPRSLRRPRQGAGPRRREGHDPAARDTRGAAGETCGSRIRSLTCRERWLVSSGSRSGNSFRSMPPQSTTPSWVQPQSRGQAGAGPGGRRRSGKSLSAGGGRAAAQPSARSPSASSARPPAGIAPASPEHGGGQGPREGANRPA